MSNNRRNNVTIYNAGIILKNFQGSPDKYNRQGGKRSFGVLLDEELAENLSRDGWPVKRLRPRNDDPDQYCQPWMNVKVNFNSSFPPTAVIITSRGKVSLNEDTIGQLDYAYFQNVDLIVTPYAYQAIAGVRDAGISAYLKAIYVTIQEDDLSIKYSSLPDIDTEFVINSYPV